MNFSIIIPVYNESKNIYLLVKEIFASLEEKYFEVIIINDNSNDDTNVYLSKLKSKYNIGIINLKNRSGQSLALLTGIKASKHDTIVTIDGDGQNDPKDIPKILNIFIKNNYSLVGGLRMKRKDNYIKKISSLIANKIRSIILNDNCMDTGCGLKIFEKKIFLLFPFFNGIHRFLPALFRGYGYSTYFVSVNHRHRLFGKSKYGTIKRAINGIRDIILVNKIIKNYKNVK